ncbi:ISP domain-containing protein [Aaosphaeria arxii CBS 175.79]|uniref:Choline monooxygenase, chloroplastic n=1 Tax=Aaosphaeria arxii CBS 175.79 TaxID=1450172 RepID=A0A6A5XDT8_9PLEO|nr:ISP domain-containing protein [Aaosphaeria arxii CBS 175.79]KAF2011182.1 ISP domain-containing protein [Aaosphaeria arxii CBS 175.79]
MLHYFRYGKDATKVETPAASTPVRALPASWYTSPEMYEMERRAIFAKRWLFITHKSRLQKAGDWVRYTLAGYDFFLIRDRKDNINALHNTCRHRAYPVIDKEGEGNAQILACRYHGWSYGLGGNLAKAPGYEKLAGFDKSQNGLHRIHVKIDKNGFIWVNMDAKEVPEVPWEEHFRNVDVQARYEGYNFDDYVLDHTYELNGDYNWKIASDNFNECYHCPTTHPDIPAFLNLDSFDSDVKDGHIQHHCVATKEQIEKGLNVHSTYYFPNVSMSVSRHFLMIQKFMPKGPQQSIMAYEVYRNKNSSDEDFHLIADMYARVMGEDKVLCDKAQKNLDRGVFVNGQLHPQFEKAPLFFQNTVRAVITEHFNKEKAAGHEINAAKSVQTDSKETESDEAICAGIACGTQKEVLAW